MHRMRAALRHRDAGGIQRLRERLSAEHIRAAHEMTLSDKLVRADLLRRQQADNFFGVVQCFIQHPIRHL